MDAIISVRTKRDTKNQAEEILASMGMSTSAAVNIFLRQVITERRMPFRPTTNKEKK